MAKELGLEPLITDDVWRWRRQCRRHARDVVLGTQMERHIAKRLRLPR